MFLVAVLIFQAHMFKAFADDATGDPTKCPTYNEDGDGYALLAVNATFRLVETTFRAEYFDTYRCITATATDKDDEKHETTEQIEYKVTAGEKWDYYTQTFIFQLDPGTKKYNKMMSLEPSGAPNGNYKFLSTDPLCIVIKALSFELPPNGDARSPGNRLYCHQWQKSRGQINAVTRPPYCSRHDCDLMAAVLSCGDGTVIPQERDADNAENVHGPYDCMLWIKDDKQTTPDDCCRDYFKKLCHYTAVRQAFSKIECEKRPSESNPEDDSKTVTY